MSETTKIYSKHNKYYDRNKERIKLRQKIKYECPECKAIIGLWNRWCHERTKKHKIMVSMKNMLNNLIANNLE